MQINVLFLMLQLREQFREEGELIELMVESLLTYLPIAM